MSRLAGTVKAADRKGFAAAEVDPTLRVTGAFQDTWSIAVVSNGSPLNSLPARDVLTNVTLFSITGLSTWFSSIRT